MFKVRILLTKIDHQVLVFTADMAKNCERLMVLDRPLVFSAQ